MTAQILLGQVMHRRIFPRENAFRYGIYYLCLPLRNLAEATKGSGLAVNRPGMVSFHNKDHGDRSGGDLCPWADSLLARFGLLAPGEIVLVAMPRVLGYVFNPVSFWLCHDASGKLSAVICEVNNTFGETHIYICPLQSPSSQAPKAFHVSPFLPRDGHYTFRFQDDENIFGAWIDYLAQDGQKQLVTTLTGKKRMMTPALLRFVFWRYPLVALVAVARIHWQAVRLVFKGISYVQRPRQRDERVTAADGTGDKIKKL